MPSEGRTTIVLLAGPPGSGKTSVARALRERLQDAVVFASDEIGGDRYRGLARAARDAAGRHRVVILDATFYMREYRDRVRALGYPTLVVHLDCPLDVCLRRNAERAQPIPAPAVRDLWARFEPPGKEEDAIRIDADRTSPEAAARRILSALKRLPGARGPRGRQRRPARPERA